MDWCVSRKGGKAGKESRKGEGGKGRLAREKGRDFLVEVGGDSSHPKSARETGRAKQNGGAA